VKWSYKTAGHGQPCVVQLGGALVEMMVLGVPFDLLMVSNFDRFRVAWIMHHGLPLGSLPKKCSPDLRLEV